MVNRSKALGTGYEVDLVEYFQGKAWPHARRLALAGINDIGDISLGDEPLGGLVVIEAKNQKAITLASFVDEMQDECENAEIPYGVVIAKRKYRHIGQSYVVTTLDKWVDERMRNGRKAGS